MLDKEWINKATVQVMRYALDMDHCDASRLADDLQQSWPGLPPEDAVRFFFHPLPPRTGSRELQ